MSALVFNARAVAPSAGIPDLLLRAHQMVDFGFSVFPLHGVRQEVDGTRRCLCGNPGCGRNTGKHPATKNGLLDATRDPAVFESWWTSRPAYNVAARTGDIVALDVDLDKAGDRSLSALEAQHSVLPRTWTSQTGGGGWHVFFAQPEGLPIGCSTSKIGSGLDVKGVGGYVVAPGSRHRSGRVYEWLPDRHPDNTPLAPMPRWLVELCRGTEKTKARFDAANFVRSHVPEGSRNDAVARLAGYLFKHGVDRDVVLELVWAWTRLYCAQTPVFGASEVARTVASIWQAEQRWREGVR